MHIIWGLDNVFLKLFYINQVWRLEVTPTPPLPAFNLLHKGLFRSSLQTSKIADVLEIADKKNDWI